MKRFWKIALSLLVLGSLFAVVIGCDRAENNSLTAPDIGRTADFIVGDEEIDEWGGEYGEGSSYFMVNIPVAGAVQIAYTIQGGGTFQIFGLAEAATKQEIGLKDGDMLESVCVSYDGSAAFSAIPANAQEFQAHDFLHYQRLNDEGNVSDWWPNDAGFEFAGNSSTVCVVQNGEVTTAQVDGPFPKSPAEPAPFCEGAAFGPYDENNCLRIGSLGQSCVDACAAHGGVTNLILDMSTMATACDQLSVIISGSPAQSVNEGGLGCAGVEDLTIFDADTTTQTASDPGYARVCSCKR